MKTQRHGRPLQHLLGTMLAALLSPLAAEADTYTVNSGADTDDGNCNVSSCTFREAINAANAHAGADTIAFSIAGTPQINILTNPAIVTGPVTIDGTTQPGYTSTPIVVLNGTTGLFSPLRIAAGPSTVRGLVIQNFSIGVRLEGGDGHTVENNWIGLNTAGTAFAGVPFPIVVNTSSNNTIANNLLAGASTVVSLQTTSGNVVKGNFLNLNPAGTASVGTGTNSTGISLSSANGNTIGGGAGEGNVIAACGNSGIFVNGNDNTILGNFIGTNAAGTAAIPNTRGIVVSAGTGTQIGMDLDSSLRVTGRRTPSATAGVGANTVSGNSSDGILLGGIGETIVFYDFVGTNSAGDNLGNGGAGVFITSPNNTLTWNTIAYNAGQGIAVSPSVPALPGNRFSWNSIGHHANELGIDWWNNLVTANDIGDTNGITNFPVITAAQFNATSGILNVEGTLEGAANSLYTIEFSESAVGSTFGNGEGETPFGSGSVLTDSAGDGVFDFYFAYLAATGHVITGLSTRNGSTGEYSAYKTIVSTTTTFPTITPTIPVTIGPATFTPTRTVTATQTRTATATRTATPTQTASHTVTRTATTTFTPSHTVTRTPTTTTVTLTPATPTFTRTPSLTPTFTRTPTFTPSFTRTPSPTRTPTSTRTLTATRTGTSTRTFTPSITNTRTQVPVTVVFTFTPTVTPTPKAVVPRALIVDPAAGATSDGNGVFEKGETVSVQPAWQNVSAGSVTLTGAGSAFTGPAGAVYTLSDATTGYGTIAPGATVNCNATGNCFLTMLNSPAARPTPHWDATVLETPSSGDAPKNWKLHIGESFADVPRSQPFYRAIETLFHVGGTSGCTATQYCPGDSVSREQMAIFIGRALLPPGGTLPQAGTVGGKSYNCVAGGASIFTDVAPTALGCRAAHFLALQNVTLGCSATEFCPEAIVTRDAMAGFMARALVAPLGGAGVPAAYGPDPVTGRSYGCSGTPNLFFTDVPAAHPFCKHIHNLWAHGFVSGCGASLYCPSGTVTRDAMAKFLVNVFERTLYGP